MNIIKAIYCRTFQKIFKLAIPFMPYRKPKALRNYGELVHTLELNRKVKPLIVTDKGITGLGLHKALVEAVQGSGMSAVIYDGTHPNPTVGNIEEAAELYRKEKCDCIIAIGGGSSIDCGKGVGVKIVKPNKPLGKMKGILKVRKRLPLMIAVPTTAGTGSECTLAAVICDPETQAKYAINDFPLIPRYALLESSLTISLPPMLTATTGLDALTHAVEAYIGNSTTRSTRAYALEAISLIFNNLPVAVTNGKDMTARQNMMQASYLAGLAFTKSYVGYVHALAHALGGKYGTPHGLANSVLLPVVLRAYGKRVYKRLKRCAIAAGIADKKTPKAVAAELFISRIEEMNKDFGIPDTIHEIRLKDLPILTKHAEKEANPLYPVPVLWTVKDLEKVYLKVMEETDGVTENIRDSQKSQGILLRRENAERQGAYSSLKGIGRGDTSERG